MQPQPQEERIYYTTYIINPRVVKDRYKHVQPKLVYYFRVIPMIITDNKVMELEDIDSYRQTLSINFRYVNKQKPRRGILIPEGSPVRLDNEILTKKEKIPCFEITDGEKEQIFEAFTGNLERYLYKYINHN